MSVEDQLRQFEAIMTCAFGVSYFPMSETRSYQLEQKARIDSPYDSAYLNGVCKKFFHAKNVRHVTCLPRCRTRAYRERLKAKEIEKDTAPR